MTSKGDPSIEITQAYLRTVISYDPETGIFTWRSRPGTDPKSKAWNTRYSGKKAGYLWHAPNSLTPYLKITILDFPRYAHRLAFIYMTGRTPVEIDHIDRNGNNNAWSNLREVTHAQNMQNMTPLPVWKSGLRGVTIMPSGRFRAAISKMGKPVQIGLFDTADEAHDAYLHAAQARHLGLL